MAVYHGAATIERALQSCADLVDEIIVSHNGPCRDRSVEIARKYTDRVSVQPEHIPAPEPYRVFLYTKARNAWLLQIDADEFLSPELREHLGELIQDPATDGYEFLWPTWYKGRYYHAYYKTALVRKSRFYLIGSPSEYLKPLDASVHIRRVSYRLEHKPPYDNLTVATFRRKWVPWARIQAEYFLKDFADIPKFNYPHATWEFRTRIRIQHPLLLGMIGTAVHNVAIGIKDSIRTGQWLFFKSGLLMACQNAIVYSHVWKHRKR